MFRHAEESGAKVFDGVKVSSIDFNSSVVESNGESSLPNIGRPVRASWSSKAGGSGTIKFDYVVDTSGRAGLLSTKYLKNRSCRKLGPLPGGGHVRKGDEPGRCPVLRSVAW